MRSGGQVIEELKPEGQTHSGRGLRQARQEAVKVAVAVTEPVAPPIKRDTGHENQIERIRSNRSPDRCARLEDAERAASQLSGGIANFAQSQPFASGLRHRNDHPFPLRQHILNHLPGLHFVRQGHVATDRRRPAKRPETKHLSLNDATSSTPIVLLLGFQSVEQRRSNLSFRTACRC